MEEGLVWPTLWQGRHGAVSIPGERGAVASSHVCGLETEETRSRSPTQSPRPTPVPTSVSSAQQSSHNHLKQSYREVICSNT